MNLLRNLLILLLALGALLLGAMFAVQNETRVPLDLLVVALPELSVGLWVLLAFAVGGILGVVTSLGMIVRLRTALRGARRKLDKLQADTYAGAALDGAALDGAALAGAAPADEAEAEPGGESTADQTAAIEKPATEAKTV